MIVPNERCEWLINDYYGTGSTTMQECELAQDLLDVRKELDDLLCRLREAKEEINRLCKEWYSDAKEDEFYQGTSSGLGMADSILKRHFPELDKEGGQMNDTVFLKEIPKYSPPPTPTSDPNYVKHIDCDGARFHVIYYAHGRKFCSERNCILNKPKEDK